MHRSCTCNHWVYMYSGMPRGGSAHSKHGLHRSDKNNEEEKKTIKNHLIIIIIMVFYLYIYRTIESGSKSVEKRP